MSYVKNYINIMRLNEYQKTAIVDAVNLIDPDAKIWLFGSRTDDNKKGGDIDIAVLSEVINKEIMKKIQIQRYIFNKIGEQKIDIVTSNDGKEAIFRLAVAEGVKLK